MNKKRYEFKLNETATLQMLCDKPKTGQGEFGEWYLYDCRVNNEDFNFFASPGLQTELEKLSFKKKDIIEITKQAEENKGKLKIKWRVKKMGTKQTKNTEVKQSENIEKQETEKEKMGDIWLQKDERIARECALKSASKILKSIIENTKLKIDDPKTIEWFQEVYLSFTDAGFRYIWRGELNDTEKKDVIENKDTEKKEAIENKDVIDDTNDNKKKENAITLNQIRLIMAELKNIGIHTDAFKTWLSTTYQIEHLDEIPKEKMTEILQKIRDKKIE